MKQQHSIHSAASSDGPSNETTGAGAQGLTCGLGLLSALLLEVAASEHLPNIPMIAGSMTVQTLLVVACCLVFRRRVDRGLPAPESLVLILATLSAAPFVIEILSRELFDRGWTLELTLLALLRNLVLGLCAASVWSKYQRPGISLSVLLAIFAGSFGDDRSLIILLSLYAVAGIWWLMGSYWDGLQDHLIAESQRTMPRYWLVILPALVVAIVLLVTVGQGTATTALRGFMPSSGGTGHYDEFASGGVNDGDALVSAQENASSFGPVETDVFLDSDESSLYDAFTEEYNEPLRKSDSERAVSLPPEIARESELQMAQAKKANREFSTVRQPVPKRSEQKDVDSDALLYVSGRTPLHLRLQEYDLFDGQNWYPTPAPENPLGIDVETIDGKPWVLVNSATPVHDIYAGLQSNVIKTVSLTGNRLPLPQHTVRLHIDRVDRPDLFAWAQQSIVRLQRNTVPSLMAMHTRSRIIAPEAMEQMSPENFVRDAPRKAAVSVPTDYYSQRLGEIADSWTKDIPRGWPQINRILQKLRTEYVHDRNHVIDSESSNPTAAFVLSDRRGPDYLFASAAAVMLRTLDYPTRLVSGFYVSPDRFDPTIAQTPVLKEDVHFWCEVYVGGRSWLPLEPTPGYEILKPQRSLMASFVDSLQKIFGWIVGHWLRLSIAAAMAILVQITGMVKVVRIKLADVYFTFACRMSSRSARDRVLASSLLIHRRCRFVGVKPCKGETERCFLTRIVTSDLLDTTLSPTRFEQWLRYVEWAHFAPESLASPVAEQRNGPSDDELLRDVCHTVVTKITVGRLAEIHDKASSCRSWLIAGWRALRRSPCSSLENATA